MVIGATDVDATAAFFARFGFEPLSEGTLPADAAGRLFDLPGEARELELGTTGATTGRITILRTPFNPAPAVPFARGPIALDVYTTNLDDSLEVVRAARLDHGPVGRVELGPLLLRQCRVMGPDGLPLVLVEASQRRPSVLDRDPGRLHSEVHSVVWSVDDVAAAGAFVRDHAGLTFAGPYPVGNPQVSAFMGLPREDVPIQMGLLAGAETAPVRLEPLCFTADPGLAVADRRLRGGLHALAFQVADLEVARRSLHGMSFGPALEVSAGRAMATTTPQGIRLQVWGP